jgi:hypothetical protein
MFTELKYDIKVEGFNESVLTNSVNSCYSLSYFPQQHVAGGLSAGQGHNNSINS